MNTVIAAREPYYLITRILSGALINANLGQATLICLMLINTASTFSQRLFILTSKVETNCVKTCKNKAKKN